MKYTLAIGSLLVLVCLACDSKMKTSTLSETEKTTIRQLIEENFEIGMQATRNEDIDTYMSQLPPDLVIYDESGELISREQQREYALRDWAIIDTTLSIYIEVDSIQFATRDSIIVFTSQRWERMMFQRDGITKDTVLTTQKHRETWKKYSGNWFGYKIEELGGEIFINGERYSPE